MKILRTIIPFASFLFILSQVTTTQGNGTFKNDDCVPGELYEGSSCTKFTMCVEGRFHNRRVPFDCPPATYFDPKNRICSYDYNNECLPIRPLPPPYTGTITSGVSTSQNRPPGGAPPAVAPPGSNNSPASECSTYEVDDTGVYDCPYPGIFPSNADCHSFYLCINSMGCVVKGFYISCPDQYMFNNQLENCTKKDLSVPCKKAQDYAANAENLVIDPEIKLEEANMFEFFEIGTSQLAYWKIMEFIPGGNQRIVHPNIKPSDLSRDSKKNRVNW